MACLLCTSALGGLKHGSMAPGAGLPVHPLPYRCWHAGPASQLPPPTPPPASRWAPTLPCCAAGWSLCASCRQRLLLPLLLSQAARGAKEARQPSCSCWAPYSSLQRGADGWGGRWALGLRHFQRHAALKGIFAHPTEGTERSMPQPVDGRVSASQSNLPPSETLMQAAGPDAIQALGWRVPLGALPGQCGRC